MAVDPMIARGVQPIEIGNTLMQVAALRQRDEELARRSQELGIEQQYRNALMQDRAEDRQTAEEREALAEQLATQWDDAFETKGWAAAKPILMQYARVAPDQADLLVKLYGENEEKLPTSIQEAKYAGVDIKNPEQVRAFLEGRQPKGTSVNLSVNTAEGFYGALSKDQALKFSALAEAAQSAPARIERADRVLALLAATPYTGAAADYKLAFGKAAKAAGFDYGGDDISNTEALASELAGATLDAIRTSGLGSGQGFTDKDRLFLEKASAGNITLDNATLRRLAILNKKAGIATVNQYNERAKRLKADQLDIMGMPQTVQPGSELTPEEAAELEALRAKYGKPR